MLINITVTEAQPANTDKEETEGWGYPPMSTDWHYFRVDDTISIPGTIRRVALCGYWPYAGPLFSSGRDRMPMTCSICRQRLAQEED